MKKLYFIGLIMVLNTTIFAQCFTATYGLYPAATFTPSCATTCVFSNITTLGYAGEYSNVNVISGNTYTFRSSNTTDFITISNATGTTSYIFGVGGAAGLTWTSTITGVVRFYTHTNSTCGNSTVSRTRRVCCISPAAPINPCTTITTLSCGTTNTINFTSGTGSYNPPTNSCGFNTPGIEKIFSFTPAISGNYSISQPTSFGYIDYFYKLVSAGCGGTGWTCIDDITNNNIGNINSSIPLVAGTSYYFLLDPETTAGGNVSFIINCVTAPPTNDNCANATTIPTTYLSTIISNVGSTNDVPSSASLCDLQSSNIWYKVDGNNNTLRASTCNPGTNFDTEIRIYTGTCSTLNSMTEIICNDDDGLCSSSALYSTVQWCSITGTTYYISIGNWTSTTAYGNIQLRMENLNLCSTLPVELISFDGYHEENNIHLNWKTATETNNDYFEIQKSLNNQDWESIGIIDGAGNSNQLISYDFIDYNPGDGEFYYRLIQNDFNGNFEILPTISIKIEQPSNCIFEYYDLNGKSIDILKSETGIYLRKCENTVEKFFKYSN